MKKYFLPANILLPDFNKIDGERWAVIACDQFTSQPEYWQSAAEKVGDAPSALDLILPEAYLERDDELLPIIAEHMDKYLKEILCEYKDTYIYLERKQSDGRIRRGVVGMVDLECYDWHKESQTLIRATEGTVPERIPPRVKIRANASVELPHIMLLIDDEDRSVIEPIAVKYSDLAPLYDFELMLGGGHVKGWLIDKADGNCLQEKLSVFADDGMTEQKYGIIEKSPLALAVGDGNHSLATAKAVYEQVKAEIGDEAALTHPSRYALAELVNIHDDALDFEPIYRIVEGMDPDKLIELLIKYADAQSGVGNEQTVKAVSGKWEQTVKIEHPEHQLTVGTLQKFLDMLVDKYPSVKVDYIHGEQNVRSLASDGEAVGFIFDGMTKGELFRSVICDGPLPRKTFSMGHAEDKRYYIEARKII